ncbi:hypothetical protein NLJ89_g6235 [Agrocybe chaxingu]|uniref:Protein kinase domain-containing protein n=1 Tax=Agrocybe chaxingu TaxID=84603 RepID=A0A9W8MWL8_9AGAR|nr:hypothetical protein NLJ89_g6235 [Agrocybe chaxingu]
MLSPAVHVSLSLGKTLAQITAELAPIPALLPLVEVLCGIIECCENVTQNKNAARQLRDRCHTLVLTLRDYEEKNVGKNIVHARNAVNDRLIDIQTRMSGWANLGKLRSFVDQDKIARDIEQCHAEISDTMATFQLASHFEIHEWMEEFNTNRRLDHAQLLESLSQIQETQAFIKEKSSENNDLIRQMMTLLQNSMGENKQKAERVHQGLSANLYQYQSQFKTLLPELYLNSGEVKKISEYPIRGTATMDIYEGLYLEREKVAIKAIRSMRFDEQSKRRFKREAEIWSDVWKRDHGMHIVPFYGYCQLDGPFPCMVSPWLKNGDALTYAKANDKDLDYRQFIMHIAHGVEVLHSMGLVHGDIRANNVLVSDTGLPLLSDFRLSKIIQSASGAAPLTQSTMMADSCRYFAPETFGDEGGLSTATDIYALAMTVLEVFPPF